MKMKLVLSLSSIAVILLVSSFISIMEYSRMSSYVANNLHFAAAIAFILMVILLVAMAIVKYVAGRYVYGGD